MPAFQYFSFPSKRGGLKQQHQHQHQQKQQQQYGQQENNNEQQQQQQQQQQQDEYYQSNMVPTLDETELLVDDTQQQQQWNSNDDFLNSTISTNTFNNINNTTDSFDYEISNYNNHTSFISPSSSTNGNNSNSNDIDDDEEEEEEEEMINDNSKFKQHIPTPIPNRYHPTTTLSKSISISISKSSSSTATSPTTSTYIAQSSPIPTTTTNNNDNWAFTKTSQWNTNDKNLLTTTGSTTRNSNKVNHNSIDDENIIENTTTNVFSIGEDDDENNYGVFEDDDDDDDDDGTAGRDFANFATNLASSVESNLLSAMILAAAEGVDYTTTTNNNNRDNNNNNINNMYDDSIVELNTSSCSDITDMQIQQEFNKHHNQYHHYHRPPTPATVPKSLNFLVSPPSNSIPDLDIDNNNNSFIDNVGNVEQRRERTGTTTTIVSSQEQRDQVEEEQHLSSEQLHLGDNLVADIMDEVRRGIQSSTINGKNNNSNNSANMKILYSNNQQSTTTTVRSTILGTTATTNGNSEVYKHKFVSSPISTKNSSDNTSRSISSHVIIDSPARTTGSGGWHDEALVSNTTTTTITPTSTIKKDTSIQQKSHNDNSINNNNNSMINNNFTSSAASPTNSNRGSPNGSRRVSDLLIGILPNTSTRTSTTTQKTNNRASTGTSTNVNYSKNNDKASLTGTSTTTSGHIVSSTTTTTGTTTVSTIPPTTPRQLSSSAPTEFTSSSVYRTLVKDLYADEIDNNNTQSIDDDKSTSDDMIDQTTKHTVVSSSSSSSSIILPPPPPPPLPTTMHNVVETYTSNRKPATTSFWDVGASTSSLSTGPREIIQSTTKKCNDTSKSKSRNGKSNSFKATKVCSLLPSSTSASENVRRLSDSCRSHTNQSQKTVDTLPKVIPMGSKSICRTGIDNTEDENYMNAHKLVQSDVHQDKDNDNVTRTISNENKNSTNQNNSNNSNHRRASPFRSPFSFSSQRRQRAQIRAAAKNDKKNSPTNSPQMAGPNYQDATLQNTLVQQDSDRGILTADSLTASPSSVTTHALNGIKASGKKQKNVRITYTSNSRMGGNDEEKLYNDQDPANVDYQGEQGQHHQQTQSISYFLATSQHSHESFTNDSDHFSFQNFPAMLKNGSFHSLDGLSSSYSISRREASTKKYKLGSSSGGSITNTEGFGGIGGDDDTMVFNDDGTSILQYAPDDAERSKISKQKAKVGLKLRDDVAPMEQQTQPKVPSGINGITSCYPELGSTSIGNEAKTKKTSAFDWFELVTSGVCFPLNDDIVINTAASATNWQRDRNGNDVLSNDAVLDKFNKRYPIPVSQYYFDDVAVSSGSEQSKNELMKLKSELRRIRDDKNNCYQSNSNSYNPNGLQGTTWMENDRDIAMAGYRLHDTVNAHRINPSGIATGERGIRPKKNVRFCKPLVTQVQYRPYTDVDDIPLLYFQEEELEEYEQDRVTVPTDQYECIVSGTAGNKVISSKYISNTHIQSSSKSSSNSMFSPAVATSGYSMNDPVVYVAYQSRGMYRGTTYEDEESCLSSAKFMSSTPTVTYSKPATNMSVLGPIAKSSSIDSSLPSFFNE